jgi:hypothetical protein
MLKGRAVVVACPKLDDPTGYVEKLAEMFGSCGLREVLVAHMEVPCCTGLLRLVLEARRRSGRDVPVIGITVGTRGDILARREIPLEAVV